MTAAADCTAVVLAGGRGRRLGGCDKGLVELGGRALVDRVLERVSPQVATVLISANRHLDAYRGRGVPVLADAIPGHAGPLAGILTALGHIRTPWLLVVPVDSPGLPTDLRVRLAVAAEAQGRPAALVSDGRRLYPTCALLRRDLADDLAAYLAGGGRRARDWYLGLPAAIADLSDCAAALHNINTPEDLAGSRGPETETP